MFYPVATRLGLFFVLFSGFYTSVCGPLSRDTLAVGNFILHKFQQPVGKETYTIVGDGDTIKLISHFKFNDRGRDVTLQTYLNTDPQGRPLVFRIRGNTSRASVIDAEVRIRKDSAWIKGGEIRKLQHGIPFFTISGYAPVSVQMQLIKHWNASGKPAVMQVLPVGEVRIQWSGVDTLTVDGKKETLYRYFVQGLIWGKETLWTSPTGELIALFTNDAEGDKFEAIHDRYVKSLSFFIGKAATYGMMDLHAAQKGVSAEWLALQGGTLIDVVNGNAVPGVTILIKKGLIVRIGKEVKIPSGARVVDAKGKFLIPGLWDMHAHFQQVEWGPAYLAAGVTTVRDCGNEFDFINSVQSAIDGKQGVGPAILKAGIVDGEGPYSVGIVRVTTREDARRVVRMYKDNGYAQIKIYSSLKPDMIKAISEEAHLEGLTVTGHVPRGVTVQEAVKLGQDQVNHITYVYQAMRKTGDKTPFNVNDSLAQSIVKVLKESHTVVDPTLAIYEWLTRPLDQLVNAFEPGIDFLPDDMVEIFRNIGIPANDETGRKDLVANYQQIVLALHKAGIPIVAGTDMMVPGFSLAREIELYHQAGLSPLECLQSATIVPARVMKKEKESGSLEVGKNGDVLLLEENPLENISAVRRVSWVVQGGDLYNPSELRAMVGFKP